MKRPAAAWTWPAILLFLVLLLPGCAERPHLPKADPSTTLDASQDLANLLLEIEGTREDVLAGQLIIYHRLQDGLVSCMKQQGFTYLPPPFVDPTIGKPDQIFLGTEWFDPLTSDFGLTGQASGMAIGMALQQQADNVVTPYLSLSEADKARYDDALDNVCKDGDGTGFQDAGFPKGFYEAQNALFSFLDQIGAKLDGFRDPYLACMAAHGVTITNRSDMFNELVYRMQPEPDASSPPESVQAYDDWLARVRSSAAADASCRADAYGVGMALLVEQLPAWEASHADVIDQVVKGWEAMVEEASSYPEWARLTKG